VPAGRARQQIIKTRPAVYPYRKGVHKKTVVEKGKKIEKWFDDVGGKGMEIAVEIPVCEKCLTEYNEKNLKNLKIF
jgi:hypothetical protein